MTAITDKAAHDALVDALVHMQTAMPGWDIWFDATDGGTKFLLMGRYLRSGRGDANLMAAAVEPRRIAGPVGPRRLAAFMHGFITGLDFQRDAAVRGFGGVPNYPKEFT